MHAYSHMEAEKGNFARFRTAEHDLRAAEHVAEHGPPRCGAWISALRIMDLRVASMDLRVAEHSRLPLCGVDFAARCGAWHADLRAAER